MTYVGKALRCVAVAAILATGALPVAAKEFRIAVGDGAGGTQEALGKAFIAALQEKSGGQHTGKLFLNGQLGDEQDTVTAAATGTLDFSILAINNITPFSPTVGSKHPNQVKILVSITQRKLNFRLLIFTIIILRNLMVSRCII